MIDREPVNAPQLLLRDEEFVKVSAFAKKNFGLNLSESKKPLVQSRLSRRLRQIKVRSFEEYLNALGDPSFESERMELLSLLTTNVTHFFREPHHFNTLASEVLPPLLENARKGRRVRFWSAGCSKGQEPYTLAMIIHSLCPSAHELDVKILGTDIDPEVVKHAQAAEYSFEELEKIPADYRSSIVKTQNKTFRPGDDVRSLVRFGTLNLVEQFPFSGSFDAIMCRNVAIYFDKPTQQSVWQAFAGCLAPKGYLFLGHSERLSGPVQSQFRNVGITTYQKISAV